MATGWTQSDIDALRAAIASGVQSVTYAGPPSRSITYQTLSEMRAVLAEMIAEVQGRTTYRKVAYSKGFR